MVIGGNGMKFKYFYSLYVLVVLYVVLTSLTLAGVDMFVDVTSFLNVFLPTALSVIGAYLYAKNKFFKVVSCTALTAGFVSSLIGVIATFSNIFDTESTFAGLAVAALPVLYALFFVLLILPISINQTK